MNTGTRFQSKCCGPAFTLQDDGRIDVDGLGVISRKWNKNVDQWRDLITEAAAKWDVPEAWIAGVMLQESGGQQQALSPVGAVGLMQIMPSTPGQMFQEKVSKEDLWKPEVNIPMGARVIAAHAKRANWNVVHVLGMYNDGGSCYAGKNCDHAGLWCMNENCGYSELVVRGINAAIDNGYSGTGATEPEPSTPGWLGVLVGAGLLLVPIVALMYLGHIQPPAFARNLIPRRNPYQPTWKDYIKGEWWIDLSGESMFADQDTGDVGHEAVAVDSMLDKNVLLSGLIAYYEAQSEEEAEQYDNKSKIAELQWMLDMDEISASEVYFTEHVPDEVGIAAAGSEEKWNDIKADARLAFAKHYGAIQVVGTNFTAHKITSETIGAMQSFIEGQAEFEEITDTETKIGVEQVEPRKYASVSVAEFLTIKTPRELWSFST